MGTNGTSAGVGPRLRERQYRITGATSTVSPTPTARRSSAPPPSRREKLASGAGGDDRSPGSSSCILSTSAGRERRIGGGRGMIAGASAGAVAERGMSPRGEDSGRAGSSARAFSAEGRPEGFSGSASSEGSGVVPDGGGAGPGSSAPRAGGVSRGGSSEGTVLGSAVPQALQKRAGRITAVPQAVQITFGGELGARAPPHWRQNRSPFRYSAWHAGQTRRGDDGCWTTLAPASSSWRSSRKSRRAVPIATRSPSRRLRSLTRSPLTSEPLDELQSRRKYWLPRYSITA